LKEQGIKEFETSNCSNLWYTRAVMDVSLKPTQRWFLIGAILLAIAGFTLIYFATMTPVRIFVDDEWMVVNTHAKKVESALRSAGVYINEGDQVFPDVSHPLDENQSIQVRRGFKIYLDLDDTIERVITIEQSLADFLASNGITLLPGDRVWVNGILEEDPARMLTKEVTFVRYKKAETIELYLDENKTIIRSAAPTLGEALSENGVDLIEGDVLDPPVDTPLREVQRAVLKKGRPVTIFADGTVSSTYVVAETVGEALQKAGLPIMGLDYAIPDLVESLPEDGQIKIVRVREEILTEQTPVPFETLYQPDPELEIDNQVVMDAGAYGVKASQIRVRYEDGQEVSRTLDGEWLAQEPEPRTVGYGTKIVIRTLNTPDGTIEYWRAIQMYATSYSPSRAGVPDDYEWFGITACGKKLVKGLVAVDTRYIPFYTMMYVPGYGFAEACDIGGGVKGRWIDLGYSDHNYKNWHQYVAVYFLTPVPPASSIAWIYP
jgi:uncharacterized protein YabE (DUF348 family)